MAAKDLADEWLRANSHLPPKDAARHGALRILRERVRNRSEPQFYCEHDRLAYQKMLAAEKFPVWGRVRTIRGKKCRRSYVSENWGSDFLSEHRDTTARECVLLPFSDMINPSMVNQGGRAVVASRLMCTMRNGTPYDFRLVARHLCGNGHLSCVNPNHLVWGTDEENSEDRVLHRGWPKRRVALSEEVSAAIVSDPDHPNVIAIRYQIPTIIVMMIKSGTYIAA